MHLELPGSSSGEISLSTRSTPGHGVDELDAETDWPVNDHVIVSPPKTTSNALVGEPV